MSERSPKRQRRERDRSRERYQRNDQHSSRRHRRDEGYVRNRCDDDRDSYRRRNRNDEHSNVRREDVRIKKESFSTEREVSKHRHDDEQTSSNPVVEKEKPNFATSGKLAEDTNTFNGVVVKYNQPEEAKIPKRKWRLYPFKNDEALEHIEIHKQSAYLLGRNRKVADVPVDHPSCSQQHAVIQFRMVEYTREDGSTGKRVRPYVIDLESSNGTFLNNKRIEAKKYIELFEKDVLKFGFSTREYVMMYEEYQASDDEKS